MITSVNDLNNNTLMALDKFAVKVATLRGKIAQAVDATLTIDTLSGNSNSQFFLENQDILALYDAGCSSSKRRLLASDIVEVLSTKSKEDQIAYLTSKYDSFFL